MSLTFVGSTTAETEVASDAVLSLAGVVGAVAGVIGGTIIVLDEGLARVAVGVEKLAEPIDTDSLAGRYVAAAHAARARLDEELMSRRGPGGDGDGRMSAATVRTAGALARAGALAGALAGSRPLAAVAAATDGARVAEARQQLVRARSAWRRGDLPNAEKAARNAEEKLAVAAALAVRRLGRSQRDVVAARLRTALPELGFRVSEASDGCRTAFRAVAGEQAMAVVVLENGRLVAETCGYEGDACRRAAERLFGRLREDGIAISRTYLRPHAQSQGGLLGARGGSDARGLLRAVDGLVTANSSPAAAAASPSSRKRAAPGGSGGRRQAAAWVWQSTPHAR